MQIPGALLYNQDVDILKELKSVTTDRLTIENDAKCAALCGVSWTNNRKYDKIGTTGKTELQQNLYRKRAFNI